MRKPRKNYTPVEKVAILRRHLIDHVPVSDLCDEHQLSPTLFLTVTDFGGQIERSRENKTQPLLFR